MQQNMYHLLLDVLIKNQHKYLDMIVGVGMMVILVSNLIPYQVQVNDVSPIIYLMLYLHDIVLIRFLHLLLYRSFKYVTSHPKYIPAYFFEVQRIIRNLVNLNLWGIQLF
jgi:hypothetical protein